MSRAPLETLFMDGLSSIYYAEDRILMALPKMLAAARSADLRAALEKHHAETQDQIERLRQIFALLGKPAQGVECPAIDGILLKGEQAMATYREDPASDAALIASAQTVEHYEIAQYGTLLGWADWLEMEEAAELLETSLEEEAAADEALNDLADAAINEATLTGA